MGMCGRRSLKGVCEEGGTSLKSGISCSGDLTFLPRLVTHQLCGLGQDPGALSAVCHL